MNFHVFELTPSDKMGKPGSPLTILKQVSKEPFLDYDKGDLDGMEVIKLFDQGFRDYDGNFSVCQANTRDGRKVICYVKITGRVVFCKEIAKLVGEVTDVERILKSCIPPLEKSENGKSVADSIRQRLNFHNAIV
jgi:hypothetical protein